MFAGGREPRVPVETSLSQIHLRSSYYEAHHRASRSPDFVFGGAKRAAIFRRYVNGPGRRVLDLGCRYGTLTAYYAPGNQVLGLDIDRHALAHAAEVGIEVAWADVDEPLALGDDEFDVVVAGELLEHVCDPQALIGEVCRVLRPGGTFVGSVPNAFRLKNRFRFIMGRHPESDPTHLHLFTPGQVRAMLRDFNEIRLHYIASRFLRIHPRLFGNDIIFACRKKADLDQHRAPPS
jgi:SAM-dependent methyltransferase